MREFSLLWHHIVKGMGMEPLFLGVPDRQFIETAKDYGLDYWCYDLRLVLADLIRGARADADVLIAPGGPGTCMLGHASAALMKPLVERAVGREVGWVVVNINPVVMFRTGFLSVLNEARQLHAYANGSAPSYLKLWKLLWSGAQKMRYYSDLHCEVIRRLHRATDADGMWHLLDEAFEALLHASTIDEASEIRRKSFERLNSFAERDSNGDCVRIAIIGDFYTTMLGVFPVFNFVRYLAEQLNVEVVWVMDWWAFCNPFSDLWGHGNYRTALRMLRQRTTGSDVITIAGALKAKKLGVDGMVHFGVFGCTPEATAIGALDFFRSEYDLPPLCDIVFDEHTQPEAIKVRLEAFIDMLSFKKQRASGIEKFTSASHIKQFAFEGAQTVENVMEKSPQFITAHTDELVIGIDVGSVTAKVVVLNAETFEMLHKVYVRTHGRPIEKLRDMLPAIGDAVDGRVVAVGVTGSGRELIGALVGADVIRNEVTAHAIAVARECPEARTVFEIGGQDSKLILLQDGVPVNFAMNTVCAAGTGAFLDHQATRLGIPIEQFGEIARRARKHAKIAGRCTVFAESDMIQRQQVGGAIDELIAGLCRALVRNYLNNVVAGRALQPPFVFCGGVAANVGIRDAFEELLGHEVYVPEHFNVMGAIGIALLAAEIRPQHTAFRGFKLPPLDTIVTTFECHGCANECLIRRFKLPSGEEVCFGSACQRW